MADLSRQKAWKEYDAAWAAYRRAVKRKDWAAATKASDRILIAAKRAEASMRPEEDR
jgi:hypothetical protein